LGWNADADDIGKNGNKFVDFDDMKLSLIYQFKKSNTAQYKNREGRNDGNLNLNDKYLGHKISDHLKMKFELLEVDRSSDTPKETKVLNKFKLRDCNIDDFGGDNPDGRENKDEWKEAALYCPDIPQGEKIMFRGSRSSTKKLYLKFSIESCDFYETPDECPP